MQNQNRYLTNEQVKAPSLLKVGLIEQPIHTRYSPTTLVSASHLTAVSTRVDSFWLPNDINSLLPPSVMTPKYVGTARLTPNIDAHYDPWTVLGHLVARNRLGRRRLGIGVTDASRRNPAVTAQAAASVHLLTGGRAILGIGTGARTSNEPYGAGREPMSITAAGLFFVMTGRSRDEVDEALGSGAMKAFALNASAQKWARHGASHPLGDDFTGAQDIIPQVLDEQAVLSMTADVPSTLLKDCLLTGTPDDVIEQIAEWRDRGLQYPVLGNISAVQPSLSRALATSLPLTRILRGLRKL